MPVRLLVTGADGQLGRCLRDRLDGATDLEWEADARDALDLTDCAAVAARIESYRPDVVVNAAAYTAVDAAETDAPTAHAVNGAGPTTLAAACTRSGATLLHVSTDYVFDGSATEPYVETDMVAPLGVYGASKLAGEQGVLQADPRHIVLRTAWVFSEYGKNFLKTMLALAGRDALNIVADQRGSPTYAGDIADALLAMARAPERPGGTYHFGGVPAVTWFDFASAIFEQAAAAGAIETTPRLAAITTAQYPTPAQRPAWSVLSNDKTERTFGIAAPDWRLAVTKVIRRLAEQP